LAQRGRSEQKAAGNHALRDEIHKTIVWAKFDALVKGTQIASKAARPKRLTAQRA
jgi:hypothetical protein